MATKSPFEIVQEFAQEALSYTPVIILGSGASAAHGIPGMWPLSTYLVSLKTEPDWDAAEITEWTRLCDILGDNIDLETALGSVRLSTRQTKYVVAGTRSYLLPYDVNAFHNLLTDRACFPLTRLYKHLFASTHKQIDVVTPNYDRIAEYAADAGQFAFHTGFTQGYLQFRTKVSYRKPSDPGRTVCIWKVHGSLDWFLDPNGHIMGSGSIHETPDNHSPLMVTPGFDKYRQTHLEPFRTIFSCADSALDSARSYLCIGYGFNDEHVQTKMVERCEAFNVPIIVITKSLSDTAKAFLSSGRCRRYLAVEEHPFGSRAYTHTSPGGFDLHTEPLWQLTKFLDFTIGDYK